jgi:hypothetical protein
MLSQKNKYIYKKNKKSKLPLIVADVQTFPLGTWPFTIPLAAFAALPGIFALV